MRDLYGTRPYRRLADVRPAWENWCDDQAKALFAQSICERAMLEVGGLTIIFTH